MKSEDIGHVARTLADLGVAVATNLFAGTMAGFAKHAQTHAPALLTPTLLGNALLTHENLNLVLEAVLGPAFVVARVNIGAQAPQYLATAAERARLFDDDAANLRAPPFSVSVFAPLHACTVIVTTQALQQEIELAPGNALFVDSRCPTHVVGLAPAALFITFTRPWFREPPAPPSDPPVLVSSLDFLRLAPPVQGRLQWRFDRYLKQRHRLFAYRVADKLPVGLGAPLKRALRGWASSY